MRPTFNLVAFLALAPLLAVIAAPVDGNSLKAKRDEPDGGAPDGGAPDFLQ
jgi:hypothetical protein